MAPQILGDTGCADPYDEYTESDHKFRKTKWSETELNAEYTRLEDVFCPVPDIPCYCYLSNDGTHGMVVMVDKLDHGKGEVTYYTVIDLCMQEVDNFDANKVVSTDIDETCLLKVYGVIATEYRDEEIYQGRGLALELYSRIVKHESRPLVSDDQQYPAGRRIWQSLPARLESDSRVQILRYSSLKLLREENSNYQFDNGNQINYQTGNNNLDGCVWGVGKSFTDIVLIARSS